MDSVLIKQELRPFFLCSYSDDSRIFGPQKSFVKPISTISSRVANELGSMKKSEPVQENYLEKQSIRWNKSVAANNTDSVKIPLDRRANLEGFDRVEYSSGNNFGIKKPKDFNSQGHR